MLQFVTKPSARYSVAEVAGMAMEGGCRWIQLSCKGLGCDHGAMREIASELMPECERNEAFLVIEDDVNLVNELKVHGVFLNDSTRATVAAAREALGAHAIVGVGVDGLDAIAGLKGLDVDYVSVSLGNDADDQTIMALYEALLKGMAEQGIDFHVVAAGDYSESLLAALVKGGCAGVAVSGDIADAENPAEKTAVLIEALDKARMERDAADL